VHVEKKHAQIRPCGEDKMQQQRHRARFADAGCAEHREMLAQHFIDVEAGRNRCILLKLPDLDHARAWILEDQPQLAGSYDACCIADRRIVGDAALEIGRCRFMVADFADQVDLCDRDLLLIAQQRFGPQRHVGNEPHEQRPARAHAYEFADRRTRLLERMRRCRRQADAGLRAADGDNAPGEFSLLRCDGGTLGIGDRQGHLRLYKAECQRLALPTMRHVGCKFR
jgi:hypothetical protein